MYMKDIQYIQVYPTWVIQSFKYITLKGWIAQVRYTPWIASSKTSR